MIYGLTLGNEGTLRDWLRHGTLNVTQGKNFDASGIFGPVDSAGRRSRSRQTVAPDDAGEWRIAPGRQHGAPDLGFAWLINYITQFADAETRRSIFYGHAGRPQADSDAAAWLKPGDVLEVRSAEIGGCGTPWWTKA